jgi:hypothetical protein
MKDHYKIDTRRNPSLKKRDTYGISVTRQYVPVLQVLVQYVLSTYILLVNQTLIVGSIAQLNSRLATPEAVGRASNEEWVKERQQLKRDL